MRTIIALAFTLTALAAGPCGAAAPAIVIAPMHSEGEHARFPRLTSFPDAAVQARVNGLLAKAEAQDHASQKDCLKQVLDEHQDKSFYDYSTSVAVTYVSRRYLSLSVDTSYDCAGAHPDASSAPLTFDLAHGAAIDWNAAFKPGFLTTADPNTGDVHKGKLAAIYFAHYAKLASRKGDADCLDAVKTDDLLDPYLRLDAAQGGFLVTPQLAHVVAACGEDIALSPDEIAPYLKDRALVDDLKAMPAPKKPGK